MKNLMTLIRTALGFVPSTERAIAGITKAVSELDAVVKAEEAAITAHVAAVDRHRQGILDATERANRAERIAKKFSDLVEG